MVTFSTTLGSAKTSAKMEVTNSNIVIAVIDTGVDTLHPLLKEHLWRNPGESGVDDQDRDKSKNGIDDDGNGYIDDVHGWNFAGNNNDLRDLHGHGTHIAGIIQSVAPKTNIMILKYFDPQSSGPENLANTVKALEYALSMKARIINYSAGGTARYAPEESILRRAQTEGVLLVAAAGNERSNSDQFGFYPAGYGLSNIIAVAALDQRRRLLASSNFGKNSVDIAAPGKDIVSTLPGGKLGPMSGTSQATAFVSGTAALLMASSPALQTPEQLIQQITQAGAENEFLKGKTKHQTHLDVHRALVMKGSHIGAFGDVSTNLNSQSLTGFSDQLRPTSAEESFEELPFKRLKGLEPLR